MDGHTRSIDAYLFQNGVSIEHYFVQGGVIGYVSNGREYDLHTDDSDFHNACRSRLIELGVRVLPDS
ncbi:hypothetical protein CSX04_06623 [Burkholderia cepacia]|nr:hypothetical protein CSX04_06623 [Burkholderia cepacia]